MGNGNYCLWSKTECPMSEDTTSNQFELPIGLQDTGHLTLAERVLDTPPDERIKISSGPWIVSTEGEFVPPLFTIDSRDASLPTAVWGSEAFRDQIGPAIAKKFILPEATRRFLPLKPGSAGWWDQKSRIFRTRYNEQLARGKVPGPSSLFRQFIPASDYLDILHSLRVGRAFTWFDAVYPFEVSIGEIQRLELFQ